MIGVIGCRFAIFKVIPFSSRYWIIQKWRIVLSNVLMGCGEKLRIRLLLLGMHVMILNMARDQMDIIQHELIYVLSLKLLRRNVRK